MIFLLRALTSSLSEAFVFNNCSFWTSTFGPLSYPWHLYQPPWRMPSGESPLQLRLKLCNLKLLIIHDHCEFSQLSLQKSLLLYNICYLRPILCISLATFTLQKSDNNYHSPHSTRYSPSKRYLKIFEHMF